MNCERCRNELEDLLYGELSRTRAAEVSAHLDDCADCVALRGELERENEIFSQFYEQTSIEPAGVMWEAIRGRISEERGIRPQIEPETGWLERLRAGALGWLVAPAILRQAAFAALLIVLSVAATMIYLKRDANGEKDVAGARPEISPTATPRQTVTPSPESSPSTHIAGRPIKDASEPKIKPRISDRIVPKRQLTDQQLMNMQIARAEREYQKAIRMLDQAIAKQRGGLDPALIKQYESSLALIDSSIAASRRAMRERPDDPTAGQFLLAAYAKKLDLMQDIAMR